MSFISPSYVLLEHKLCQGCVIAIAKDLVNVVTKEFKDFGNMLSWLTLATINFHKCHYPYRSHSQQ